MGAPMATRLQNAGYPLCVFNRTKEKSEALVSKGAHAAESPSTMAAQVDVALTMVSTPEVLEHLSLGKEGILSGLAKDCIHIDCSTVSPALTKQLAHEYGKKGCRFLHSPVLGSVSQVMDGALLLFVGGEKSSFERVEPILKCLGSKIWYFERVEQASTTKLLCNSFISGMAVVLSQALLLAEKSEINPQILLEIISHSQLNAPMYQAKGKSMIERNFAPRFFVEHLLKDINLVLDAAVSAQLSMPAAETAQRLYKQAVESGLAKEDYSAIIQVIENLPRL